MNSKENVENETERPADTIPKKSGFSGGALATLKSRYPKLMELLRDLRVQAFILFILLSVFYLNLIIWDFYFSADSMGYGLILKGWFEEGEISGYDLLRPAHPLTMPLAILFTYPMLPLIGSNYLLGYAILDAILGAFAVSIFYLVCLKFVQNRKFSLICSLALAFSFTFWENSEMAEDRILGFVLLILYIPLLFTFLGEIKPFKWFENLKTWQKGLITGIFMGLVIVAHFSFVLLFLFSLILGWRYHGLKFFKSPSFIWYLIGTALVSGIVFGVVALVLEVGNVGEFIGMFFGYHGGEAGAQYFALSDPGSFSLTVQFRGLAGGVFTAFFMFISEDPLYKAAIIGIGAIMILIIAYIMINARKNKVVSSFYLLMVIWFAHFFFFAPDDRNSWAYLLVPIWLSVCIGLDIISKEGVSLIILKRRLPDKAVKAIPQAVSILIAVMFINNTIVYANAHFNRDEREKFVHFVVNNVQDDSAIIIVDESTGVFFSY
ncbi:MAG: hypothetical protein V3U20_05435 [Thermoplasmata archaeon]